MLTDENRNIFLTLSEDRENGKDSIYTPVGGEVEVRNGQNLKEAAVAETWEEVGLMLNDRNLVHVGEPQLILPTPEYDPYDGVGIMISSYVYNGEWSPDDVVLNMVPEPGCLIVDTVLLPLPSSMEEINSWDINIYPNFAEKLLELDRLLQEGKI